MICKRCIEPDQIYICIKLCILNWFCSVFAVTNKKLHYCRFFFRKAVELLWFLNQILMKNWRWFTRIEFKDHQFESGVNILSSDLMLKIFYVMTLVMSAHRQWVTAIYMTGEGLLPVRKNKIIQSCFDSSVLWWLGHISCPRVTNCSRAKRSSQLNPHGDVQIWSTLCCSRCLNGLYSSLQSPHFMHITFVYLEHVKSRL